LPDTPFVSATEATEIVRQSGSSPYPTAPVPVAGDRHLDASDALSAESQYVTGPEGLYRPEYVAKLWGVSRTKIFELIRTGRLRSLKIGGSRRIPESALAEYISRQSEGGLA
jgi:excisionase family DNA binding protein